MSVRGELAAPGGGALLVVDGRVDPADVRIAGVSPGVPAAHLPARGDGVAALAAVLEGVRGLATMYLISQGAPGRLRLGDTELSLATLAAHAPALDAVRQALGPGGNLLLFGSDVATGAEGRRFLGALAMAIGAKVAATMPSIRDHVAAMAAPNDWRHALYHGAGIVRHRPARRAAAALRGGLRPIR